jgi:hypothetical protein
MKSRSLHEVASEKYSPFVKEMLEILVAQSDFGADQRSITSIVDMNVTCAAEELIPQEIRASQGIFFTGDLISKKIASSLSKEISNSSSFFDPSCGAGNLIFAIARSFPLKKQLFETIELWAQKFGGCDLSESFILATKLRLIALALHRHGLERISKTDLDLYLDLFNSFQVIDYLGTSLGSTFDCIVANPPFGHITAPACIDWSSGKTQQAGIFIAQALTAAKPGQRIVAVLPDVLRSGTRYKRWRHLIEQRSTNIDIEVYGKFSKKVDVDVFLLSINSGNEQKTNRAERWQSLTYEAPLNSVKLNSVFDVRVGPVVPHRLSEKGGLVPYLTTHDAPAFLKAGKLPSIKFSGTLYDPPFVVVRRTSSPSDKARLVPSLIEGSNAIAVENHLIIIKPKDGKIEKCLKLMEDFRDRRITDRLNNVSRCRHLTTTVLSDIDIIRERYE